MRLSRLTFVAALAGFVLMGSGCAKQDPTNATAIRVGYFPNVTHAQAITGLADGTFTKKLGPEITIESTTFNAGPEEMEALFAGQIDIAYIGPSPAVNGYIKSNGEALRIISGAMANGVALVGQPELVTAFAERGPEALAGKKIASPQQGNTQDVALRTYLAEHDLTDRAEVLPVANADQLTLFSQGEIDAAWSPEPWASRLMNEAGAELLVSEETLWPEGKFNATVVVARKEFLDQNPDLVRRWLEAHAEVTNWLVAHPAEAQVVVNAELEKLTTKKLDESVMAAAWERLQPTTDPLEDTVRQSALDAYDLGFLGATEPDLTNLFDLRLLNEITTPER